MIKRNLAGKLSAYLPGFIFFILNRTEIDRFTCYNGYETSRKGGAAVMGTAQRRQLLLKALRRRRHDTIRNLAVEFEVSERTIRRDIEILSLDEAIYTVPGRYAGGVYMLDGGYTAHEHFSLAQTAVLKKLLGQVRGRCRCELEEREIEELETLIRLYEHPQFSGA